MRECITRLLAGLRSRFVPPLRCLHSQIFFYSAQLMHALDARLDLPVDWPCNNGHDHEPHPCLFESAHGARNVSGTFHGSGNFTLKGWLIGTAVQNIPFTIHSADNSTSFEPLPLVSSPGPADDYLCGDIFKSQDVCTEDTKKQWTAWNITMEVILPNPDVHVFMISLEEGARIIVYSISPQDQPSASGNDTKSPSPPPSSPVSIIVVIPSTALSNSTTAASSTLSPSTSAGSMSGSLSETVRPTATETPFNDHVPERRQSKARTIAPAVVVPMALILAGAVAFYFWRRRQRLARVAPSARFKGESPEMKPWLPLDAKRSASR